MNQKEAADKNFQGTIILIHGNPIQLVFLTKIIKKS